MPILRVGATAINYRVRRSKLAKRKRIVVTPDEVEVVVPLDHPEAEIAEFVHAKRRWVYDKREQLQGRAALDSPFPTRFATGGKVLYRGRRLRLIVEFGDVEAITVDYRNGFHVRAPASLPKPERESGVEAAISAWMKARVRDDAKAFIRRHAPKLSVEPAGLQIKAQRHLWGSCGADRIIRLNWQLIFAPKPVLEYVVVHELCHLRHRNHSREFWRLVASVLPEYEPMRAWLERHGGWQL